MSAIMLIYLPFTTTRVTFESASAAALSSQISVIVAIVLLKLSSEVFVVATEVSVLLPSLLLINTVVKNSSSNLDSFIADEEVYGGVI